MAYDDTLAARLRALLEDEPGLTEQKMFGGLAFMIHGNMAVAAASQGDLMLRVDPKADHPDLDEHGIRPMEMKGRLMSGWLLVDRSVIEADANLQRMVQRGLDYARTLPPKTKGG